MSFLTRWFLDNPVAANLLMVFILVAGLLSFSTLRVESFPQIPPTRLEISVAYPGGTATQVDAGITQRIEDAISSVPGIHSITSQSSKGYASIMVKKNTGVELDRLMEDVRNQVDSIEGFPALAERPRIVRDDFTNLASFVMVYGGQDDGLLQDVASRVETALKKHPDISKVTHLGKRKRQLVIEPDPDQLRRYGLNVAELAERVGQWSLEYRTGELKTDRGNIVLQGSGYADNLRKLENIPLITTPGSLVRLGDVATLSRGFADTDSVVRFQGENAIALMISTSQKDHLFRISDATQAVLDELRPGLPESVKLDVMADMSPYITEQLDLLSTNAWQGLLIVLVLLGLFLEVRLAFWVALGIPISLAGAVWLMGLPSVDYSINDITLFGMILVLGILVDDAVVVGESIHDARARIQDPKEAAWHGVKAVSTATVFGVLTTIAAFSPMLWIENELAKVLAGFSAVVIFALVFSLIESKFILPTHLSYPKTDQTDQRKGVLALIGSLRTLCTNLLNAFSNRVYQPLLRASLRHKAAALLLFGCFFVFAYGGLIKGHIHAVFFPEIPGRYATVKVTMSQDAAKTLTARNAEQLERALQSAANELQEGYQLSASPIARSLISVSGGESTQEIELTAELSPETLANIPSQAFLATLRQHTGVIEGSYAVNFTLADEPAGGTLITVSGRSREAAKRAANELKLALAQLPGVNDVYDDSQSGRRQLRVVLNDRGKQLGVDQRQLATLVGGAFGHIDVHRILEHGEETQVLVRYPEQFTRTLEQLKSTPVQLASGDYVSLGEISDFVATREPDVLYRRNRDQVITVQWRQDRTQRSPEQVWAQLQETTLPDLKRLYPDVTIEAAGEFAEISEVQAGFKKAMLLTLLLIYVLLAIPLKSYWQPFIIMAVIPFGFAGALLGHWILGLSFSLLSLFGMMAMTGVVINDSLVLMTRFNQLVAEGFTVKDALIEAGKSRLRAIFLTTVTTVCGLLPLLSETSEQAQYLKPAAVSLVFGELFATPITLIMIPVLLGLGRYARPVRPLADSSVQAIPNH